MLDSLILFAIYYFLSFSIYKSIYLHIHSNDNIQFVDKFITYFTLSISFTIGVYTILSRINYCAIEAMCIGKAMLFTVSLILTAGICLATMILSKNKYTLFLIIPEYIYYMFVGFFFDKFKYTNAIWFEGFISGVFGGSPLLVFILMLYIIYKSKTSNYYSNV